MKTDASLQLAERLYAPEQRPFRFGVVLDAAEGRRDRVIEAAKRAEAAGAEVLLATDHLGSWGALARLQAAAESTRLRIGTLVLNNDLRHPPVLAQELATLDAMTDGRLEIGLGAGWNRPEYEAAGLHFDPPADRLRRMRASLRMIRQALADGRIDYEADDAYPAIHQEGLPTSIQRPHPPFLVGGGGPKLLAFAAREADIIGIDPRSLPGGGGDPEDITGAAVDRKVGWIREAAGDRWAELEINVQVWEVDPEFRTREGPLPPRTRGISEAELPLSPHYLVGDTNEMVETLLARRARWGISYITFPGDALNVLAPVMARLRSS
jgi:probable F420-dependent oxidoreductase